MVFSTTGYKDMISVGKRKRPSQVNFFYLFLFEVFDLAFDLAFAMRDESLHSY